MKAKLLFVLLAVTIILTSCDKSLRVDENPDVYPDNDVEDAIAFDDEIISTLDIKKVSHQFDRAYFTTGAETSFGFYDSVIRRGIPTESSFDYCHSANIVFVDYQTEQMIYLCNVPGCVHNNSDCTSFIEYSRGLWMVPDYDETHIIVISLGTSDRYISSSKELASILIMDLDGSNRKEVIRLNAREEISMEDALFVDSQHHIYYVVVVGNTGKEIRRTNLENGETEVLLTTGIAMVCKHSYGDNLLLEYYDQKPGDQNKLLSVSTGIITDKKTVPKGYLCVYPFSHYYMAYYNEDINNADTNTVDLAIFDYETDDIVKTINNIPCSPGQYCKEALFANNKVEWLFSDNDGNNYGYIIDLNTGACVENSLKYLAFGSTSFPVPIISDVGSRLLVMIDNYDGVISFTDYQGIPHVFEIASCPVYALISVEDYCSGIPNYHIIENKVFVPQE